MHNDERMPRSKLSYEAEIVLNPFSFYRNIFLHIISCSGCSVTVSFMNRFTFCGSFDLSVEFKNKESENDDLLTYEIIGMLKAAAILPSWTQLSCGPI